MRVNKDFNKWSEVKIKTNSSISELLLREGEIRWCRFGTNIGFEIDGKGDYFLRPVLILKKFSKDVFLGLPITLQKKSGSWYFYLENLQRTVILNQARILDKRRLEEKVCEVSEKILREIKAAFCALIKS